MPPRPAGSLVVFGMTGDLAKKLVLPALYKLEERGAIDQPVIGVARSDWNDDDLKKHVESSLDDAFDKVDSRVFNRLMKRMTYIQGEYDDSATFDALKDKLGDRAHSAVYYLAVPPSMFAVVAAALGREGLNRRSRLVVEKPFGNNLATARELDGQLRDSFPEEQIFRVDHFLGKESVEDLFVFRFANGIFEPIWNREHVASVQLTFAEKLDVADRGGFYDAVGATRDVVQNHLFQVLAYLAMDAPSGRDPGAEQRERTRLLRSVRPLSRRDVVRGQYDGYRSVDGVARNSTTETFIALKLAIENTRWDGVPFFIRTGKCLPNSTLEAIVELRPAPRLAQLGSAPGNRIRLRLQPEAAIICEVEAKAPGDGYPTATVPLALDVSKAVGPAPLAYERVLEGALTGSGRHFTSLEAVEQSWRIVDKILDLDDRPASYKPGSWGPAEADRLPGRSGWIPLSL